jgi:hypothetical protein
VPSGVILLLMFIHLFIFHLVRYTLTIYLSLEGKASVEFVYEFSVLVMFKIIWIVIQLVISLRGLHPDVDMYHYSLLGYCVVQDVLYFNLLVIPNVHVFVQTLFRLVARLLLDIFVVY